MRYRSVASLLAFCCLFANGCSKGISRATAATVFSVKGNVVFGSAERNDFQPVTLKSRIHNGNIVRSADGASIDFALIPGALAQLSGNSEIKIKELRLTKDGNQTAGGMRGRSARIELNHGKISVWFNRSDRSRSQFAINTRQATVRADSDCLFCVWTDGTTTRVTCARGEINVSPDTQPLVTIAAGYFQKWPTERTEPVVVAEDAAAQIDITESLEIGEQLRDQAAGWQNRGPF
jgi:hypothetical protein